MKTFILHVEELDDTFIHSSVERALICEKGVTSVTLNSVTRDEEGGGDDVAFSLSATIAVTLSPTHAHLTWRSQASLSRRHTHTFELTIPWPTQAYLARPRHHDHHRHAHILPVARAGSGVRFP